MDRPVHVQRIAVPDRGPSARPLDRRSYTVAFQVDTSGAARRSPEQWLRSTFEDAPRRWRWFLLVGWTALTCRLQPRRSPTRVLGWQVASAADDRAEIVVHAWVGLTSRLAVTIDEGTLTLSSIVDFTGPTAPVARVLWALTVPLHERVLPHLLAQALGRAATP